MTTASHSSYHATIVIKRTYSASVERVFGAFANPPSSRAVEPLSDTAVLIYDEADFRVGGRDTGGDDHGP